MLEAKRLLHPELHRPLSWRGLQRIAAREGIGLHLRRLAEEAQLVRFYGTFSILVNADLPPRRHTYRAAHELAHLWLHVDRAEGRGRIVFNFGDFAGDDARELEAETLATLLLGGPRLARHF